MTVAQLRKALKGIKGNVPVYIKDHDHDKYETNSLASTAKILNQKDADPWDKIEEHSKIEGDYFVISG